MNDATVFVPERGHDLGIDPKSGIVGAEGDDGRVTAYYEGNRFGAGNIVTFADRCWHAFDRMRTRYPTIAFGSYPAESLIAVGTFTPGHGVDVTDAQGLVRLSEWLEIGHREVDDTVPIGDPRWVGRAFRDTEPGAWIPENSDRLHRECRLDGGRNA